MAQPIVQASFNSGEWSPALYARVDVEKYKSGAALLRNFFVDYRGGASTRPGSKYCLQAYKSNSAVRLIPFQATFDIGFALEFGDFYVRFFANGAPVLETSIVITGITKANPAVVSVVNAYAVGDWVYISNVSGMTQINNKYYIITARTGGTITLSDLFGNPVNSTAYGTWTLGGTVQRVYTIASPYSALDLNKIKFAQNVNELILCHPSYAPYLLTYISSTNWTLAAITFGTTVATPTGTGASSTLPAGNVNYAYVVTAVDETGQESAPTPYIQILNVSDLRTTPGTNSLGWLFVTGASSYNVYKAEVGVGTLVPPGVPFGFIGNVTNTQMIDSNIAPDYSQSVPIIQTPFGGSISVGSAISGISITVPWTYTVRPTVTIGPPAAGTTATGTTNMMAVSAVIAAGGAGYVVNDTLTFTGNVVLRVTTVSAGAITGLSIVNPGTISSALPANPLAPISTSGAGTGGTVTFGYGVASITMTNGGTGYLTVPPVTFSAGAAAGTAVLGPTVQGNPSVPAFFQQRLVLAGPLANPQNFYMSQPGSYFNFNTSAPIQDDDAIAGTLVSGQLNNIKSMVPQPAGLLVLTDGASWLLNGGSFGSGVTPASIVANPQSFNGANDVPPIISNYDALYVQSKGSSVRDSTYNFYANVFTGTDISILASHLFFNFQVLEWAWAEEPFKLVWAIRNDGVMLSLTFLKEQEFTAWAHHDTDGAYKSVASIIEPSTVGSTNAIYNVVQRTINGNVVQYIERFAERTYPNGVVDAWCVDCGLQYDGFPATTFSGLEFLVGKTVTGLADGQVITPFVVDASGVFTLPVAASKVTVGLPFTAQLKTLPIDLGQPTVQGKVKQIPAVTIRVADTLGLFIGSEFGASLTAMKDLIRGEVSSTLTGLSNQIVADLVDGDAQTILDARYTVQGQYCLEQNLPYPASVLGVIPEVSPGDTAK